MSLFDHWNEQAKIAQNCIVNILAVEFLIKTNDAESYSKWISIANTMDEVDNKNLYFTLALNRHINNLGEMITQDDYKSLKEDIFEYLYNFNGGN